MTEIAFSFKNHCIKSQHVGERFTGALSMAVNEFSYKCIRWGGENRWYLD